MSDFLNVTQLIDWLEGRLPEHEAEAIADAVGAARADESLNATVTWLRTFLDLSKSTVLVEPPDEAVQAAAAHFRASVQGKRQAGWFQTLVAKLTSDSWQRPSLAGVRHTGLGAAPRQLVYAASTADVVLNTQVGTYRNTFDLIGQVFPTDEADPASFTVQLIRHELEVALTFANEVGKFTFADLPAGVYTLMIRGDQAEITVADLELFS